MELLQNIVVEFGELKLNAALALRTKCRALYHGLQRSSSPCRPVDMAQLIFLPQVPAAAR